MASLAKVSVLVIDDNAHMIHIIRSILQGFGVNRIYESRNAVEAIDLTRREKIDLIIVDYQMPELDGVEFTEIVRRGDSRDPFVPIILLTAHSERSKIFAARDSGVTEVCAKPINARELWLKFVSIVNRPRPFIRSKRYFGPDRRRQEKTFQCDDRRAPEDAKSAQADQLLVSA